MQRKAIAAPEVAMIAITPRFRRLGYLAGLVFLAILGVWWFSSTLLSLNTFHPFDLGLDFLTMIVFSAFLSSMIARGYTVRGIVLLIVPMVACILLRYRLVLFTPSPHDEIDPEVFHRLLFLAIAYLWIVFVWIFGFPSPNGGRGLVETERVAQWKRGELALAVSVGLFLAYETIRLLSSLPSNNSATTAFQVSVHLDLKRSVLFLYWLFLVRGFVHFGPPESEREPGTS